MTLTRVPGSPGELAESVTAPDGGAALIEAVALDGVGDGAKSLAWNGSAVDTTGYATAFIEVTAMGSGTTAITVNASIVGTNALQVQNVTTNATSATITAAGLYAVPAVGNLSYSAAGGTPTVNLILKR